MKLNKTELNNIFASKDYEQFATIFPENILSTIFTTHTSYRNADGSKLNIYEFLNLSKVNNTITIIEKKYKGIFLISNENEYLYSLYENFGKHTVYNTEKIDIFNKILKQLKKIDIALQPLIESLGISYEINLTGGAVRDFLTGKHNEISDLDILISTVFPQECILDLAKIKNGDTQKENFNDYYNKLIPGLKVLKLENLRYEKNINAASQLHYFIINELINRKLSIDKIYTPSKKNNQVKADNADNNEEDYNASLLLGVIKLNKNTEHYPVDLLITHSSIIDYNHGFDLNICKTYFNYHQLPQNITNNIDNLTHENTISAIESINMNEEFLIDIIYKRLTFNFKKLTVAQMKNSLTKHYSKVQKKYHDYKLYLEYGAFEIKVADTTNSKATNDTINFDEVLEVENSREENRNIKEIELYEKLNKNFMDLNKEHLHSNISDEMKKELLIVLNYLHLDKLAVNKENTPTVLRRKI